MMDEIKITAYQCKQCGKVHYPFHERCLECKGTEFDEDMRRRAIPNCWHIPRSSTCLGDLMCAH